MPLLVTDEQERATLIEEAASLPSIVVSSATAANAVMLGGGYFTPLSGYMNINDALSVAEKMHTVDGLFWPVPVLNLVEDAEAVVQELRLEDRAHDEDQQQVPPARVAGRVRHVYSM